MTQLNKFRTEMTEMNKFEDLNNRFVSLGTGMTRQHKFKDR